AAISAMAKARAAGTWARFCWKVISQAKSICSCTSPGSARNHSTLQEYTWESGTERLNVTHDRMSLKPLEYSATTAGSRASATPCWIADGVSPQATGVGL